MSLSQDIKHKTIELGFDLVGVTDAAPIDTEQAAAFAVWLKSGFAGDMDYMHRNLQKRLSPARLAEGARSVIVAGLNYTPPKLRAGHFLGLRFDSGVPDGLLRALAEQNIYVSVRGDSMRITPHLYNNDADIERFFSAMQASLEPGDKIDLRKAI